MPKREPRHANPDDDLETSESPDKLEIDAYVATGAKQYVFHDQLLDDFFKAITPEAAERLREAHCYACSQVEPDQRDCICAEQRCGLRHPSLLHREQVIMFGLLGELYPNPVGNPVAL